MNKQKETDVGKGVALELKTADGKKENIFGKVISVQDDGVEVETIPKPYVGERPKVKVPYEVIENFRYLQG